MSGPWLGVAPRPLVDTQSVSRLVRLGAAIRRRLEVRMPSIVHVDDRALGVAAVVSPMLVLLTPPLVLAPMLAVALRESRIDEAFLRDLNEGIEMGSECYDMLVSTGTFTHGHVGAGCLPELMKLLVPEGCLICTVHRDVWVEGGFGTALEALTEAGVAAIRSREADCLFEDEGEPSGWYLVVEKLPG